MTVIKVLARAEYVPFEPEWTGEVSIQLWRNGEVFGQELGGHFADRTLRQFVFQVITPPGNYKVTAQLETWFPGFEPYSALPEYFEVAQARKSPVLEPGTGPSLGLPGDSLEPFLAAAVTANGQCPGFSYVA